MSVVTAETISQKCSSIMIIRSIPVINVKRNNFTSSGEMPKRYFYFILFSFDQNLNSPKYAV